MIGPFSPSLSLGKGGEEKKKGKGENGPWQEAKFLFCVASHTVLSPPRHHFTLFLSMGIFFPRAHSLHSEERKLSIKIYRSCSTGDTVVATGNVLKKSGVSVGRRKRRKELGGKLSRISIVM